MRYKFYREHKYVSAACNDLERLVAQTDFRVRSEVEKIEHEFDALVQMLKGHAEYEDTVLHELLRKKSSNVYKDIEDDHHKLDQIIAHLESSLKKAMAAENEDEQVELGYQFYLWYRKFVGDNLVHLHEEETIILPELQRLYTDQELSVVEFGSYRVMTAEELVHMLEVLFPHMNPNDREVFLTDIKACDPVKFEKVWSDIQSKIEPNERDLLVKKLKIS